MQMLLMNGNLATILTIRTKINKFNEHDLIYDSLNEIYRLQMQ